MLGDRVWVKGVGMDGMLNRRKWDMVWDITGTAMENRVGRRRGRREKLRFGFGIGYELAGELSPTEGCRVFRVPPSEGSSRLPGRCLRVISCFCVSLYLREILARRKLRLWLKAPPKERSTFFWSLTVYIILWTTKLLAPWSLERCFLWGSQVRYFNGKLIV